MLNGIINVYKEPGFTSHDVVAVMRGICGQKKIGHEVDNIPAGKVCSGFFSKGFREPANEIFKDIAAVHGADLIRAKVAFRSIELLDNEIEGIALHHSLVRYICNLYFCKVRLSCYRTETCKL